MVAYGVDEMKLAGLTPAPCRYVKAPRVAESPMALECKYWKTLEIPPEPEWASAGHGSYGTIEDYGRFIRAMLRDGELDGARILAPETVTLAFSEQLGGVPLPNGMKSADPVITNDVPSLPIPQGWGLGFHLLEIDLPGGARSGTGDWAGIFNCYYWIDRATGVGGALMTQVLPFFDMKVVETEPGLKGATVSNVTKPAKLETGLVVQVPAFIGEGEKGLQQLDVQLPSPSGGR